MFSKKYRLSYLPLFYDDLDEKVTNVPYLRKITKISCQTMIFFVQLLLHPTISILPIIKKPSNFHNQIIRIIINHYIVNNIIIYINALKSKLDIICQYALPTKEETLAGMKETVPVIKDLLAKAIVENAIRKLEKIPEPECSQFVAATKARFLAERKAQRAGRGNQDEEPCRRCCRERPSDSRCFP